VKAVVSSSCSFKLHATENFKRIPLVHKSPKGQLFFCDVSSLNQTMITPAHSWLVACMQLNKIQAIPVADRLLGLRVRIQPEEWMFVLLLVLCVIR
jgi:hypothetical protein